MSRRAASPGPRSLSIGELAAAAGLAADALRFYEREGLLPRAARTAGGYRRFDPKSVERLRFIKQAKAHGLMLREIRDLVEYQDRAGSDSCRRVRALLSQRLAELDVKRRELETFSHTLNRYLEMCDRALARSSNLECPVIEDLGREPRRKRAR